MIRPHKLILPPLQHIEDERRERLATTHNETQMANTHAQDITHLVTKTTGPLATEMLDNAIMVDCRPTSSKHQPQRWAHHSPRPGAALARQGGSISIHIWRPGRNLTGMVLWLTSQVPFCYDSKGNKKNSVQVSTIIGGPPRASVGETNPKIPITATVSKSEASSAPFHPTALAARPRLVPREAASNPRTSTTS